MALNVMLVFFRNYDSDQLHHLEKWYIVFSYGVPFIPCLSFIIIDHYGKQRIIGPATVSTNQTTHEKTMSNFSGRSGVGSALIANGCALRSSMYPSGMCLSGVCYRSY